MQNQKCLIFNKGNTCYVNVILQAVRPLSAFWSDSSTPLQTTSSQVQQLETALDSLSHVADAHVYPFYIYKHFYGSPARAQHIYIYITYNLVLVNGIAPAEKVPYRYKAVKVVW